MEALKQEEMRESTEQYKEILSKLSDSPESISSVISMLCISDIELRDALASKGMTPDLREDVKKKIEHLYTVFLKRTPPDLSWMDKVEFKFLKNTDQQYTIPLPHKG